eukprot:CAMPEP_0197078392 /NCGR_PEP_ID=MMETSP1384-20130603/213097_1 /TAXON_ID=29189 /ORGANISM="Ammonia sp." /LENGTH=421 /DNA_ID=CAMNT_0042517259 /DNA_START=84 /DNA_END=1349 /DNA_ORIENTATION=-
MAEEETRGQTTALLETSQPTYLTDLQMEKDAEEEKKPKKPEKSQIDVLFEGKIKNLSDINLVDQTFRVQFHVYTQWLLSDADAERYKNCEQEKKEEFKTSLKFEIVNAKEISMEHEQARIQQDKMQPDKLSCRQKVLIDAICNEQYELQSFPFDVQDLTLDFKPTAKDYTFVPMNWGDGSAFWSINPSPVLFEEYALQRCVVEFYRDNGKNSKAAGGKGYSHCVVRMKLERNARYYILNYFSIIGLINLGAFTSFGFYEISVDSLGDRMGLLVTLILAAVAEQLLITSGLPNLQYLTLLDVYSLSNFLFLVLLTIVSSILCYVSAGRLDDVDLVQWNSAMFIGSAAIFFVGHVLFIALCIKRKNKERRKIGCNGEELDKIFGIHQQRHTMMVHLDSEVGGAYKVYKSKEKDPALQADPKSK